MSVNSLFLDLSSSIVSLSLSSSSFLRLDKKPMTLVAKNESIEYKQSINNSSDSMYVCI